jgi:hypothetical protein
LTTLRTKLCAGLILALLAIAAQAAPPIAGALSAAEVKAKIVGHSVVNDDKTMTWYYHPGGKYEGDDGNSHEGTYTIGADGRLCWKENNGISGCFLYVRKGKGLVLRRADPGHDFELGPVTIGPL